MVLRFFIYFCDTIGGDCSKKYLILVFAWFVDSAPALCRHPAGVYPAGIADIRYLFSSMSGI